MVLKPLVAMALAVVSAGAFAQLRTIPAEAKLAKMTHITENLVEVDGKREPLSPGAQIRDQMNRIILPPTLPPASVVKVQRDPFGAVHRVWILTPDETPQPAQQ